MEPTLYETAIADGMTAHEIMIEERQKISAEIELSAERRKEWEAEEQAQTARSHSEKARQKNLENKLIAASAIVGLLCLTLFLVALTWATQADHGTYGGYNVQVTCEKGKPCPSPFQNGGTP